MPPHKNNRLLITLLLISLLVAACSASKNLKIEVAAKPAPAPDELYNTIANMDSIMFAAFNAHDLDKLKTTFSEDLEFYHDKGGLSNYNQTMQNFKTLFENNKTTGLRRDLVKGSLEVYPIKDYGAVETCLHRFCHVENGKDQVEVSRYPPGKKQWLP